MKKSELIKVIREELKGYSPQIGQTKGLTPDTLTKILTKIAKGEEDEVEVIDHRRRRPADDDDDEGYYPPFQTDYDDDQLLSRTEEGYANNNNNSTSHHWDGGESSMMGLSITERGGRRLSHDDERSIGHHTE